MTANTNKQWRFRKQLVKELENWVYENLNTRHTAWGRKFDKKSSAAGKRRKATQYVIEHLALGKMRYPLEETDPLFTEHQYKDESMQLQLKPGLYPAFQKYVQRQLQRAVDFDPRHAAAVTWREVSCDITERGLLQLQSLCDGLDDQVDKMTEMIGLMLRYQCMGGFTDNFHGSVPSSWGTVLDNFTECFASPFNHKFENYYSMFEQDRIFGSKGNFFRMIERNGGSLPPGGYEINPPWMNAMYDRIAEIIEESILKKNDIQVIIVGPNWKDTTWIPSLDMLLGMFQTYKRHSFSDSKKLLYNHDMTGDKFSLDTAYWVFSSKPIGDQVLKNLRL